MHKGLDMCRRCLVHGGGDCSICAGPAPIGNAERLARRMDTLKRQIVAAIRDGDDLAAKQLTRLLEIMEAVVKRISGEALK